MGRILSLGHERKRVSMVLIQWIELLTEAQMLGFAFISMYVGCSIYVQHRGRVRHATLSKMIKDHGNLFSPINCLFYLFSKVSNTPYLKVNDFSELKVIQENWMVIRNEALTLNENNRIDNASHFSDYPYHSFYKKGWRKFGLKWYGTTFNSANRLCPSTVSLIESVPSIKAAMFTVLPAGKRLNSHRDPYAGSLRYQLGLHTPNSAECHIDVDGKKDHWQDGEAVMFDETYLHYIENNTEKDRLVLMLDIRRPVHFFFMNWLDSAFSYFIMGAAASQNTEEDRVSFINKTLALLSPIERFFKRLKAFNRTVYYGFKYGAFVLLIYALIFGLKAS